MSNYPIDNANDEVKRNAKGNSFQNGSSNPLKTESFKQKEDKAEKVKNEVYNGIEARQAEDDRKRNRGY